MKHVMMTIAKPENEVVLFENTAIKECLVEACVNAGANVVAVHDYEFTPIGYSCVVIISESHATIHTYPEEQTAHIDFFTCSEYHDVYKFIDTLVEFFRPKEVRYKIVDR